MVTGINKFRRGFTLIELLIAIVIFGILFVGLLNAIFFGMHVNILNSQRIRARQVMKSFIDELRNLPPDHPNLVDVFPGNGVRSRDNPDHSIIRIDEHGMRWEILWNVEQSVLDPDLLDIGVYVLWGEQRFFIFSQTSYYRGGRQ